MSSCIQDDRHAILLLLQPQISCVESAKLSCSCTETTTHAVAAAAAAAAAAAVTPPPLPPLPPHCPMHRLFQEPQARLLLLLLLLAAAAGCKLAFLCVMSKTT